MELNCLFFIWMSSLQNDVATRGWYDDDPHCTVAAVAADEGVGTQLTRPHSPLQRSRYIKKTNFKTGFLRSCPKGLWNPGVCTENLDLLSSCRRTFEIWSLFWNNLDLFWARALGLLKSGDCTENLDLLSSFPLTFETWGLFWKLGSTELLSLGFWNLGFDLKTWNNWARVIGLLKPGVCYENLDLYTGLVFVLSLLVKARL